MVGVKLGQKSAAYAFTMITHAFTCTGPYAMLILAGVKFVENRSGMPVERQGRCAISALSAYGR